MEGMQEDSTTPGVARNTGQGSVKPNGGCWKQGRLCPHEPQEWQVEGHHPTKPTQ